MSKKIDFFNNINIIHKSETDRLDNMVDSKKKSGSKTAKETKISNKNVVPKRRGRRLKKILENDNEINNLNESISENKENSAIILGLKLDPSKLKKLNSFKQKNILTQLSSTDTNKLIKDKSPENSESSEGMFKNDIPMDTICHKCEINEKALALLKAKLEKIENKDKLNKSNKIYQNKLSFISYTTGKKILIKKTNIKCWWDSFNFNTLPCFLPELYHNSTYHVTGCFCSFNCALAYNLYFLKDSKTSERKTLVYKLYRELRGLSADDDIDIKEAPPRELLADYGGDVSMTIDMYRRTFTVLNKDYIVFIPPIKPISTIIEEKNSDNIEDDDDKKYILKRSKPLTKKRSVISSMKIKINEDDD